MHLTTKPQWEAARSRGRYAPAGFAAEGFVHCSRLDQVTGVARAIYAGTAELVVLFLDESRITVPVRYEGDDGYPHVYGEIELDWVVAVTAL